MDQVILNEEWRSIDGYINYQVSNIGRVRNSNTGRILTNTLSNRGYYEVRLSCHTNRIHHLVHRLVANEFLEKLDNLTYYVVDHIDRDKTNNKVYNLRYATQSQNELNKAKNLNTKTTSVYKGVCRQQGKWISNIRFEGKIYHLGSYDLEEEAAVAYNMKALELAEEHAYLNNI